MSYTSLQLMKRLAAERLQLKDLEFAGFERIDTTMLSERTDGDEDTDVQVEAWANFRVTYEGELPESYRTINAMIMDWVDGHEKEVTGLISDKLIAWLTEQYPNADLSDLEKDMGDFLWEDQVDYMPEVDEDKKTIGFTVELVMDIEEDSEE